MGSRLFAFLGLGALGLAVFAYAAACIWLFQINRVVAAAWPLNALILAAALRGGAGLAGRAWVVGVSTLALFAASLAVGLPLIRSLDFTAANLIEIMVALACLWRTKAPLVGPRAHTLFVLGAVVLAPLVAGGVEATLRAFSESRWAVSDFVRWVASDSLGMLLMGPVLLNTPMPRRGRWPNPRRVASFVITQALVLAMSVAVCMQPVVPALFLIFPVLVVATLGERRIGGPIAVLTVAGVALVFTLKGLGPAVVARMVGVEPVVVVQVLIAACMFNVLPVAALMRKLELYAAELEQRRLEAVELSEIRTRLLAHVSHEIRSPLSGVTSMAELMRDGLAGELTEQQREMLAQMARSGEEAQALASDLLDAATLQSGKASVRLGEVGVEALVEAAVAQACARGAEFGGAVTVVGPWCGDLYVRADAMRVRQILVNLIINALKYGGRPPIVQVAAFSAGGGAVRFEVSDNGKGLTDAQREGLFRSFERLGAEKSDIEGAGLGLALSRQLAELQGGALGVAESELGGARFWLELPRAATPAKAAA